MNVSCYVVVIKSQNLILKPQGRDYTGLHRDSMGSVFGQSNDELSPPPPPSELMPVVTCADGTDLEEALREISREISSEFSCARDTDPGTSPGQQPITETYICPFDPFLLLVMLHSWPFVHSRCRAGLVQWHKEEDPGDLLHSGAVCPHSLFPQQWAKSSNTVPVTYSRLKLRLCRQDLYAQFSFLWSSVGYRVSTTRPWEDAPSRKQNIVVSLGRSSMAA